MPTVKDFESHLSQKLVDLYDTVEAKSISQLVLMHVLNVNKTQLSMKGLRELNVQEIISLEMILEELLSAKPVQYVLGETEFYGCRIKVNEHVLIPRQETEELVHWILADLKYNKAGDLNILDICTGSGCIPIALKKNLPNAKLSGLDISYNALETATQNAVLNKAEVQFYYQDILNAEASTPNSFDIIVSNPPYVRELEKEKMHKNVLDFEPHLALFVTDNNPLIFYKAIADYASKYLKKGGSLYFEINEVLGSETKAVMEAAGFYNVEVRKDLYDKDRMIKGILK
ncbi:peptide chain release factor N(5)-glutamine methyltransferase [Solitalea lacus]|uniref:peptide chain release factor N(5)-glutamine methyltransferase n=1 Tax=Solitalea lacus TaxID=2911172 RepID=UPI001EDB4A34|nr:peptide chain release factor N(5)-glutamine methyltransferase [Solitalea lacus]UKJ06017.1 peptide chain release factor N(5)-glutamine methyltransferase [Solitalea lacus]